MYFFGLLWTRRSADVSFPDAGEQNQHVKPHGSLVRPLKIV